LGEWDIGMLTKLLLTVKLIKEYLSFDINIPLFHHSIIPSVGQELKPRKIHLISISCRISETFKWPLMLDGKGIDSCWLRDAIKPLIKYKIIL